MDLSVQTIYIVSVCLFIEISHLVCFNTVLNEIYVQIDNYHISCHDSYNFCLFSMSTSIVINLLLIIYYPGNNGFYYPSNKGFIYYHSNKGFP